MRARAALSRSDAASVNKRLVGAGLLFSEFQSAISRFHLMC